MFKNSFFLGMLVNLAAQVFSQTPAAITGSPQAVAASVPPVNQRKVDSSAMYHRVYAVVPIVGSGTTADPLRPMFAPQQIQPTATHSGILGFQMQVSDDGKSALVEFVAATRNDLLPVISSTATGVTIFERGTATQAQIEAEFQKYKKTFKLSMFSTRAQ